MLGMVAPVCNHGAKEETGLSGLAELVSLQIPVGDPLKTIFFKRGLHLRNYIRGCSLVSTYTLVNA